jgi:hypothetical protein
MAERRLILSEFLPYQLSVTSNAVSDLIAQSYRGRFALKIPEWRVMAVLGERAESTQRDLVSLTAMDKVTVNRATRTLTVARTNWRLPRPGVNYTARLCRWHKILSSNWNRRSIQVTHKSLRRYLAVCDSAFRKSFHTRNSPLAKIVSFDTKWRSDRNLV